MDNDARLGKISDLSQIESSDGSDVYYKLFDSMYDGMGLFELRDGKVRALYLNERFFEIAGYTKEQYRPYLDNVTVTFFEEDEKRFLENALKNAGLNREASFEVRGYRADGSVGWFCIRSRAVSYVKSDYPVFLAAIYDCTSSKELEQNAKLNKARYRILEEIGANYLFEYNPECDEMIFSPGRDSNERKFMNYSRHLRMSVSIHPEDAAYFYTALLGACRRERKGYVDARISDREGGWLRCRLNYTSVAGDRDNVVRVLGRIDSKDDGDQSIASENSFELISKHSKDGVALITERLKCRPKCAVLIMADIDGMNRINEEIGFEAGTKLLGDFEKAAAEVFKNGIVFRYMEDIFAVYIEDINENALYYHIDRLRTSAANINAGSLGGTGFCAGAAWINNDSGGEIAGDLLITAAHSLYRAKMEGKNTIITENASY